MEVKGLIGQSWEKKEKNLFDQDIKDTYGKRFRKKTEVEV